MKDLKLLSLWEWRDSKWDESKLKNEIRWANRIYGFGFKWSSSILQKTNEYSFHILKYF
jgi:hypothetical protein